MNPSQVQPDKEPPTISSLGNETVGEHETPDLVTERVITARLLFLPLCSDRTVRLCSLSRGVVGTTKPEIERAFNFFTGSIPVIRKGMGRS